MNCAICEYAHAHGWLGRDHKGAHCRGCHLSWTAPGAAHCTQCHAHFTASSTFDLHWCDGRGAKHRAWCDGDHHDAARDEWAPKHGDVTLVPGLIQKSTGSWTRNAPDDPSHWKRKRELA